MPSAPDIDCYTTPGNDLLGGCLLPDVVAGLGGQALFGLIVGGAALAALVKANDYHIGTPAVVVLGGGAMLIPLLPAQYAQVARAIAFVGLVAALVAVGKRYFLDPNA